MQLQRLSAASARAAARSFSHIVSGSGSVPIPSVNYTEYILSAVEAEARRSAGKAALIDGLSGAVTLYADLPYRVGAAARGLAALGVKRGSVVGLHLPNLPEFVVAFQAIASLGAVATTSNPLYSVQELSHQLKDSGAQLIVTVAPLQPTVAAAAAAAGLPAASVLVLGSPEAAFLTVDCSVGSGNLRRLPEIEPVDAASTLLALPYSSGTTGLPKGVALSHRNLAANIEQSSSILMTPSDVVIGVLPLYHI
jgi:acyl-CoA synthetase (AMP-forming)/AMP-acid ligase II